MIQQDYNVDLPIWWELAADRDPVLELGAGTGRVARELAAQGSIVIALDKDPALLTWLGASPVEGRDQLVVPMLADATDFELPRPVPLAIAPTSFIQLVGPDARLYVLDHTRRALLPGGVAAFSVLDISEEGFEGTYEITAEFPPHTYTLTESERRFEGGLDLIFERRVGARRLEPIVVRYYALTVAELVAEAQAAQLHLLDVIDVTGDDEFHGGQVVVFGV